MPFSLRKLRNEVRCIKLAGRLLADTAVDVPAFVASFEGDAMENAWLLMTRVAGRPMVEADESLSWVDAAQRSANEQLASRRYLVPGHFTLEYFPDEVGPDIEDMENDTAASSVVQYFVREATRGVAALRPLVTSSHHHAILDRVASLA